MTKKGEITSDKNPVSLELEIVELWQKTYHGSGNHIRFFIFTNFYPKIN